MLLKALVEYAASCESLTPPMYQETPIRWFIDLDEKGTLKGLTPTSENRTGQRRRDRGRVMPAPHAMRASAIRAKLLADNAEYVLGVARDPEDAANVARRHAAFVEEVRKCAAAVDTPALNAVAAFLARWSPEKFEPPEGFDPTDNMTFRVGRTVLMLLADVKRYWASAGSREQGPPMTCLVCGEQRPAVERLEFRIKGIPGGQQAGTALISANEKAFESYGLKNSLVGPTCASCGELFAKAASSLIASAQNSLVIGRTVYIFWSKQASAFDVTAFFKEPDPGQVRSLLESPKTAKRAALSIDQTLFYAAGLTANNARVAVRDWIATTIGDLKKTLGRYFALQKIVRHDGTDWQPLKLFALAAATVRDPGKDLDPRTPQQLLHFALRGGPLPSILLAQVIYRNRAEQEVTQPRAALAKMVLLSQNPNWKEGDEMVELDEEQRNPAYLCGRLLAGLENVQQAAIPGLETGVVERFYGAASATPAMVFPTLVRKGMVHLGKLKNSSPAAHSALSQRIEQIVAYLPKFPSTLALQEQGLFSLGYFHQRAHDRGQARERREAKQAAKTVAD